MESRGNYIKEDRMKGKCIKKSNEMIMKERNLDVIGAFVWWCLESCGERV